MNSRRKRKKTDDRPGPRAGDRRPSRRTPLAAVAAAIVLSLAAIACGDATGPNAVSRGILRFEVAEVADTEGPSGVTEGSIEAPDRVQVGETFIATVTTIGLNGCWRPVDEEVSMEGLAAEIVPFDTDARDEDLACTTALASLEHSVELSFDQPGEAVLTVQGRRVIGKTQDESEPLTLETTVSVVP